MTTEPSRLDRIEAILEQTTQRLDRVAEQQENTTTSLEGLTGKVNELSEVVTEIGYKVDNFISTATTVLGRSTMLDEIILSNNTRTSILENIVVRLDRNQEESNRNFELHQQRFEENQRSTNAALERLEAILIQLMDK
ncbi:MULTISPECIES: hypothetical protein [Aphanizomenon]|uniref:hypothetical protein n=1 Tax=Aphanizomenon TaxID=1175 RepID=UPI00068E0B39|nr:MULTISPECIES: hypothetical protein [Aphanizomenon]MDK2411898.1 hypothetical protein [Aphanizomenon sp. 202]MDK2462262.1 hypothetical protein [Aphanizomenon sp. PH219]MTJ32512.1 hypothetical protein [Aphanizomenon sp. UHCC 0183]